jgi:hypothetical protein
MSQLDNILLDYVKDEVYTRKKMNEIALNDALLIQQQRIILIQNFGSGMVSFTDMIFMGIHSILIGMTSSVIVSCIRQICMDIISNIGSTLHNTASTATNTLLRSEAISGTIGMVSSGVFNLDKGLGLATRTITSLFNVIGFVDEPEVQEQIPIVMKPCENVVYDIMIGFCCCIMMFSYSYYHKSIERQSQMMQVYHIK